ncbi:hypothetical protein ACP4OV_001963 [Aristida adscensionis]
MDQAPVSASLGTMGSLLQKLDKLLLEASSRQHLKSVVARMQLLREDLEELGAYLEDLSEVEDPPPTAKCWMKEVRELSYDMDDYINSFRWPGRSATVNKAMPICKINRVQINCFPKKMRFVRHKGMTDTIISKFRIRAQQAIERHERYELDCHTFRRRYAPVGPMLPTPYEEDASLVIDARTREFIDSLAKDAGDEQLKVVSILGSGGIGKTTLVRLLYKNLRRRFHCQAFVRMNRKPSIKTVLHDVLTQVQRQQAHDACQDLDLIRKIRKHLQDKRYLIIIDDLYDPSVWDIISHAFPEGNQQSRIITTTEIEDVALSCCSYYSENVFEMKPLHRDLSRKLFFNRFYSTECGFPQESIEASNRIVEICGGLPLATISIASLLGRCPVILMEQLEYIYDSVSSVLRTSSTSEGMRLVLNFSYNNLTHYLKTCLLYLYMYPEGTAVFKDDLVKQWVAECFIDAIEGRDMEKVAESYFDELVERGFLQPACIKYDNQVISCTVHHIVHDLIAYKSGEENFIKVVEYDQKNVELSERIHRLSLQFGEVNNAKTPGNIRISQVRSLSFSGLSRCVPCIAEFHLLRVLNLRLSGDHGEDKVDLSGISELLHLRHFKVTGNVCIELPKHMQGLKYLETLDVDTTVTGVPWDIIHLPCLLHLHLPFDTNPMVWVLSMRPASLQNLGMLTNLQNLRLTCSTPPTEHLLEALGALLSGHGSLKALAVVRGPCYKNDALHGSSKVTVSWDNFTAPLLLQRFECFPQGCTFSRVPKWMKELDNLSTLRIAVRELVTAGVDILRGLPVLTCLSLYVEEAPAERIVFYKDGFSALRYFKLRCSTTPWLKFEADAVPNLQKLKLGFSCHRADQYSCPPISIEHLLGLKEISMKIGGTGGADAEFALAAVVSNHPSNPRINVQLVDCDSILEEGLDEYNLTADHEWEDQARTMATYNQEHRMLQEQWRPCGSLDLARAGAAGSGRGDDESAGPPIGGSAAELEAAERVVMRWGGGADEPMLFDFDGGGDREEAERFLRAVDDLLRLAPLSSSAEARGGAVQVAMARLEDEFRHVLSTRAIDIGIEEHSELSLFSISNDPFNAKSTTDLDIEIEELSDLSTFSISSDSFNARSSTGFWNVEEDEGSIGPWGSAYSSPRSIREIDLRPDDAIADLRGIASRMAAAGYGRECAQVYASVRKPVVDASLRRLGLEQLSTGDVQRLAWDALVAKIRRWIRAARAAIRGVFASERRLCFHVYHGFPTSGVAIAAHDTAFAEAVKDAALQLFGFAEAISIGCRSPEKLFKVIDLHDALSDLLPDVSDIFAASTALDSIYVQAVEVRSRLADAVRGILSEFENAVLRDPSKTAVPGGTIHPLTRYVMCYSSLICDYKATLSELIVSRPSASARLAAEGNELAPSLADMELPELESQSPLAAHIVWIIAVLQHNLEGKAALYKDLALSHLFMMNNVHYIVHKVKDSTDLWGMIGDDYLKRLTGKFTVAATNYQRTAWLKILNCLRDEGLHVTGGFLSGISNKSALRERFRSFNAAFEDARRVQSGWCVPDHQLRNELRLSIAEKLLPAYRSFLGRFRHHIEPELYIKYSVEDLEVAVGDFFEGVPPSQHNRRRSHG